MMRPRWRKNRTRSRRHSVRAASIMAALLLQNRPSLLCTCTKVTVCFVQSRPFLPGLRQEDVLQGGFGDSNGLDLLRERLQDLRHELVAAVPREADRPLDDLRGLPQLLLDRGR